MSSSTPHPFETGIDRSRYWSLVHDGQIDLLDWDDGERLLALSSAVRSGVELAQSVHFRRHGAQPGDETIVIYVGPNSSLELLTEYGDQPTPRQSRWFG